MRHCEVFCYRIEQLRALNLLLAEERKTVRQQQKCWSAFHIRVIVKIRTKYVVEIRAKHVVKIRVKYVVKIRVKYVV